MLIPSFTSTRVQRCTDRRNSRSVTREASYTIYVGRCGSSAQRPHSTIAIPQNSPAAQKPTSDIDHLPNSLTLLGSTLLQPAATPPYCAPGADDEYTTKQTPLHNRTPSQSVVAFCSAESNTWDAGRVCTIPIWSNIDKLGKQVITTCIPVIHDHSEPNGTLIL